MKRYDLIVVGAGPSGLSAAIEAARRGMAVAVFDENARPGGQLFKQIHKFFGSKEHKAKIRGYNIGDTLLSEADEAGVEVHLNATVAGMYMDKEIVVRIKDAMVHVKGDAIIVATGAAENMVTFEGWTLPGVIGAGAAQTMMNLHGVRPGSRVLMLGSGNVGLVVSFQLMQAGCEVAAVVDAAPQVGGYGVHAAKLARCGVPFYLSHTIARAEGDDRVTGVIINEVDSAFKPIPGTEKHFEVDTICMAVGLSPMSQLLKMAGCQMEDDPKRGGQVPVIDAWGQTSVPGIFAAGDVSGIEEASSAMIEGRMAGVKNLAVADAKVLGIVGPGVINCTAVETFAKLRPGLNTLKIKGRGADSIKRCIDFVTEKCPQFANIVVCDTLEECVRGSDILSFATSTPMGMGVEAYPFVKTEWIKPGALFCLPAAANFEEDLIINQAKLVVDNIALYEAWADEYPYPTFEEIYILGSKFMDMIHDGKLEKSQIHDLGAILNGRVTGRENNDQIILYSVGGMPVEDVAWGKEIYDYAKDHHIGTGLNLWEKPYLF